MSEKSEGFLQKTDKRLLEWIAEDIVATNNVNSSSWSLYINKYDDFHLGIEQVSAFALYHNNRGAIVLAGNPEDDMYSTLPQRNIKKYASTQNFSVKFNSVEEALNILDTFADQHHTAIVSLSSHVKELAQKAKVHQTELVKALSDHIGQSLPQPGYAQKPPVPPSNPSVTLLTSNPSVILLISNRFSFSGLHYTESQIATFYTALQTKGFVVLSGISGTGKSKIATGFVEMLPGPDTGVLMQADTSGLIHVTVRPYMKKNRMIVLPIRSYGLLAPMDPGASYHLPVTVNGKQGTGRFWFRIVRGGEQYLLSIHQMLQAEISHWEEGQPLYLDPVINTEGDKVVEFRITTDSPPGEVTDDKTPQTGTANIPNHLFLSVRPDWRDSTSLLGYYNPLTQTYEWTDFLRFLLRARDSYIAKDGLAWFVILDEMNLAHVEYYFADLLSVIESGRDEGGWTREPLRLTYPDLLDDDVPSREVKLPPNLYVIGTVNMDETTHAFSPKVLDRAFTIELSDVNFQEYQIIGTAGANTLDDASRRDLLAAFTRQGRFARIDKAEFAAIVEDYPTIRSYLHALNELLKPYRFHFGYRVFDEIAQYLYNNRENGMMPFMDAFDQAVFMKVLPKFNGSRARLLAPLRSLLAWTSNPDDPTSVMNDILHWSNTLDFDTALALPEFMANAVFPTTAARARQMLLTLETDGFVSFG